MTGALPLKDDWWGEQCGDDRDGEEVMELHIVQNPQSPLMEREADRAPDIENLTDTKLDETIDRLQKLVPKLKLADGGRKLGISLRKHIDEKNRRSRKTHHKPDDNNIADIGANAFDDGLCYASRKRKPLMEDGQQSCHDSQIRNRRRSPRRSISFSNQLESSQFSSISEENGSSQLAGNRKRKPLMEDGQQSCHNSQIRNRRRSPRRSISFSNQLESSQFSSISEENGSSQLAGKKVADLTYTPQRYANKCFSVTPESSMKKIIVVLDEDDEKPKRQYQARKIPARWKKDIQIYYPERNHPESVEIHLSDKECLSPFSYLSSAIMNFYIQYLQRSEFLCTEQKNEYHFFNTFFYSKLEEALDSQSKQEDRNSFAKLRRWFKGVNIFEKAYIFLPIHACQHWSLAIISIPAREDEAGPIILHLDSLGLHTSRTIFENIRSYLKAEWDHLNQDEIPTQVPIAEKIWKDLPHKIQEKQIQVPQQENDYDCGLFVLLFMEHFIKKAPARLRKKDLDAFGRKWFLPAEASDLRNSIKALLEKLFKEAEKSIQDAKDDDSLPVVLEDLE